MVVVSRSAANLLAIVLAGCGWMLVCHSVPLAAAQEQSGAAGALRKIKDVSPVYPEMARQARIEGTVVVEITVGTDGRVASARVRRSVPLLDQAALEAVRQWVYDARGVSAPVTLTVSVPFALPDGSAGKSAGTPAPPQPDRSGSAAPPATDTPSRPSAAPPPPAAAPRAQTPQTLSEEQTLRGIEGFSIAVVTDGPVNNPARPLEGVVRGVLKQAGIPVLEKGAYPRLMLSVDGNCCLTFTTGVVSHDYTTWAIRLSVQQLVALPGATARDVSATTWQVMAYGAHGQRRMETIGNNVRDLVRMFAKQFDAANPGRQSAKTP